MKLIRSSPDLSEIGVLKGRLELAHIKCTIRNEFFSQVIPTFAFEPELWILNDADLEDAEILLSNNPLSPPGTPLR